MSAMGVHQMELRIILGQAMGVHQMELRIILGQAHLHCITRKLNTGTRGKYELGG